MAEVLQKQTLRKIDADQMLCRGYEVEVLQ